MRIRLGATAITALLMVLVGYTGHLVRSDTPLSKNLPDAILRLSGALRVFLVDAFWMRMHGHLREGREDLVLTDARTLLTLEPDSVRVRCFLHEHLIFNMAPKAVTDAARAEWISEGFDLMEEGLRARSDSTALKRVMGMTFLLRADDEGPFRRVCLERYGRLPVELAPRYLETAWRADEDPQSLLAWLVSLLDLGHYLTGARRFEEAARVWSRVVGLLPEWLAAVEKLEDRLQITRYYEDLRTWCALMAEGERDPESKAIHESKINTLQKRLLASPLRQLDDEVFRPW